MKPDRVIIHIEMVDGAPPSINGIRIQDGAGQEPLIPPEILMLMARCIDWCMAQQTEAARAQAGPKIQIARGPVGRG